MKHLERLLHSRRIAIFFVDRLPHILRANRLTVFINLVVRDLRGKSLEDAIGERGVLHLVILAQEFLDVAGRLVGADGDLEDDAE